MGVSLIGLSVGACIYDMVMGVVDEEDVICIMSGTLIKSAEDREHLIAMYRESAWYTCREKATHVFNKLMDTGKIIQPRVLGLEPAPIYGGRVWAVQVDHEMLNAIRLMHNVEEANHG